MGASSSKGEGSNGKLIVEADLDSYDEMFRAFMKRDHARDFFSKGEGSDDNLMACPGRYNQIFREVMLRDYADVSLVLLA